MAYEFSPEGARRAREAFQRVLDGAVPAYELGQLQLFHEEDEAFIKKEVERKLWKPDLPNGGSLERKIVEKLKTLARDRDFDGCNRASYAAQCWLKVLPEDPRNPGRYYKRHKLNPRTDKDEFLYFFKLRDLADMKEQWDKKWFAELMLEGLPEAVSNFRIECLFLLRGPDANVTRLVRLANTLGERSRGNHIGGSEVLEAEFLAAPEKFRTWCLRKGPFNWAGNQKELHLLHEDVWHEAAWRVVTRVDSCGWHALTSPKANVQGPKSRSEDPPSLGASARQVEDEGRERGGGRAGLRGIWFFDECAYGEPIGGGPSQLLLPDDDGITWFEGEGYYLSDKGRESSYSQKRPKLRPMLTVGMARGEVNTEGWGASNIEQKMGTEGTRSLPDTEFLREFFREVCRRLFETLGGYEGWLALGAVLAYAAGPELFHDYQFCGGLWVHGIKGSGKSSLVRWLMKLWGFSIPAGLALRQKTTSAVGMMQQAENYSYLPLWMDEFRQQEVTEDKHGILGVAYDRFGQAKWSPDGLQREFKTWFVVCGETTSGDAATRSRYAHVQTSANKREGEHGPWMEANGAQFSLFGRTILERRQEYVELFRAAFKGWMTHSELARMDDRERKVHGVAYAGFTAMTGLLEAHSPLETGQFAAFLRGHAASAAQDVAEETNVNVFWNDMVTAFEAGAIPLECFRMESKYVEHAPGAAAQAPNGKYRQGNWKSCELYIYPELMISNLQIWLTKQRGQVTLKRKDLRDQSSKNDWWIAGKLRKRFGSGNRVTACWGIYLDKHPLGYQGPVKDEEVDKFIMDDQEGDPRKGPLYAIVDKLEGQERATG